MRILSSCLINDGSPRALPIPWSFKKLLLLTAVAVTSRRKLSELVLLRYKPLGVSPRVLQNFDNSSAVSGNALNDIKCTKPAVWV